MKGGIGDIYNPHNWQYEPKTTLDGGFKDFLFSSLPGGRFPIWQAYFSDGLVQPPTSKGLLSIIVP